MFASSSRCSIASSHRCRCFHQRGLVHEGRIQPICIQLMIFIQPRAYSLTMSDAKALVETVFDLIISASDPTNFSWKNTDLQAAFQWTRLIKFHFETNSESTIQALEVPNESQPFPSPDPVHGPLSHHLPLLSFLRPLHPIFHHHTTLPI